MMPTATIQISNSDNKLSQDRWSAFCKEMRSAIAEHAAQIFFEGGSKWDAPQQNACWVCEVPEDQVETLKAAVSKSRERFEQDSAAITIGEPKFI